MNVLQQTLLVQNTPTLLNFMSEVCENKSCIYFLLNIIKTFCSSSSAATLHHPAGHQVRGEQGLQPQHHLRGRGQPHALRQVEGGRPGHYPGERCAHR